MPRLRSVEAFALPDGDVSQVGLRDRSGLSDILLTISQPALHILSLMDGAHTLEMIQEAFESQYGQPVSRESLHYMADQLEKAHFLEGEAFETFYGERLAAFRAEGVCGQTDPQVYGLGDDGPTELDRILESTQPVQVDGRVCGLVAPHLDYPRGEPCYALAYAALCGLDPPDRVVLLGTNHFGRSSSVVGTASDFVTPFGTTAVDHAFLDRLESRCGDLRQFELDHQLEHSIDLQVVWLQHIFGAGNFEIVPFLCPDPCGLSGTHPHDGAGVDLREFADSLAACLSDGSESTLVIAGADLSHVGAAFGDDRHLDEPYLAEVGEHDRCALSLIENRDPDGMVQFISSSHNQTNVCSAGCLFALARALPHAEAKLLGYHQAVDQATQTCVSCAALVYTDNNHG